MRKFIIVIYIYFFSISCVVDTNPKPLQLIQTTANILNYMFIENDIYEQDLFFSDSHKDSINKTDDSSNENHYPSPECGICANGLEPVEEICNEEDDDCDCETDENWAEFLGIPCRGYYLEGIIFLGGYCTEEGIVICKDVNLPGPDRIRCSSADPISAFSIPEMWTYKDSCDGIDIDCDGLIDEDCIE